MPFFALADFSPSRLCFPSVVTVSSRHGYRRFSEEVLEGFQPFVSVIEEHACLRFLGVAGVGRPFSHHAEEQREVGHAFLPVK